MTCKTIRVRDFSDEPTVILVTVGYATLFAEDRPDIATFNYLKKFCGFKKAPVDHFMRLVQGEN